MQTDQIVDQQSSRSDNSLNIYIYICAHLFRFLMNLYHPKIVLLGCSDSVEWWNLWVIIFPSIATFLECKSDNLRSLMHSFALLLMKPGNPWIPILPCQLIFISSRGSKGIFQRYRSYFTSRCQDEINKVTCAWTLPTRSGGKEVHMMQCSRKCACNDPGMQKYEAQLLTSGIARRISRHRTIKKTWYSATRKLGDMGKKDLQN